MTPEDKQLLFKDICARLPYGIYCQIRYKRKNKVLEECKQLDGTYFNSIECLFRSESGAEYSADYKPYLRPISSMTEEEKKEFDKVLKSCNDKVFACPDKERRYNFFDAEQEDFMNAHHFDHRGLIEKGLALVAPEGMYKK